MAYRILFLDHVDRLGGAEVSLLKTVQYMHHPCFAPHVALPADGPLAEALRQVGATVHLVPFHRFRGHNEQEFMETIRRLAGIIRAHHLDLVHANGLATIQYAANLAPPTGLPVVAHIRDILPAAYIQEYWPRLNLEMVDVFIAISQAVQKSCRAYLPDAADIRVLYNAVDLDEFHPNREAKGVKEELGIPAGRPVVGTVGRMDDRSKRFEDVVRAAAIVVARRPDVTFLVVGDAMFMPADYSREIRELAAGLGLDEAIIFTGYRSDVSALMAAMDIFVTASAREPFGRVILEAMASAKPVIAPAAGGIPEIVTAGQTGILVPPYAPQEMATAILYLLDHPETSRQMGNAARRRAADVFNMSHYVAALEDIYRELLTDWRRKK